MPTRHVKCVRHPPPPHVCWGVGVGRSCAAAVANVSMFNRVEGVVAGTIKGQMQQNNKVQMLTTTSVL